MAVVTPTTGVTTMSGLSLLPMVTESNTSTSSSSSALTSPISGTSITPSNKRPPLGAATGGWDRRLSEIGATIPTRSKEHRSVDFAPGTILTMPSSHTSGSSSSGSTEDTDTNVGDDDDSTGFEKTLASDIDPSRALELLRDLQSHNDLFKVFTNDDLVLMSQGLSVLRLEPGEKIISKGEQASFAGIILEGEFGAVLSETNTTIPLKRGDLVGEMSYFLGGIRTADIVTVQPSVLAVLTFEELNHVYRQSGELQGKLIHLFGVASCRKLRSMIQKPNISNPSSAATTSISSPPQAAAAPVLTIGQLLSTLNNNNNNNTNVSNVTGTTSLPPSPPHSPIPTSSSLSARSSGSGVPSSKLESKKGYIAESLYRGRLAKQQQYIIGSPTGQDPDLQRKFKEEQSRRKRTTSLMETQKKKLEQTRTQLTITQKEVNYTERSLIR
jgi:hypothetical protein